LELPMEARPPDFHGAIGTFSIASDVSPVKADAGDPLTLRLRITGSGNFDRVESTMIDHLDQWKTYPPKSSFNTSDPIGFSGMKTFEQPVIAAKPGAQKIPGLSFSYFDPSSRRYETAHTAPLEVAISPALADSTLTASQVAAGNAAPQDKSAAGLRPDHGADARQDSSVIPLYLQPRFLIVPSLLVAGLAAGWLGVRRRREQAQGASAQGRVPSKAVKRAMNQLDAAARARDAAQFFEVARGELQHQFAARWRLSPEEITSDEIENRIGADADVLQLFALADEAKYSGREPTATDFSKWKKVVLQHLTSDL
jgi:hypothetical protein